MDLPNGHLEGWELTRAKTENYHPMVSSFPSGIYLEVEEAAVIVTFLETLLHEISCEVLIRSLGRGVGICAEGGNLCRLNVSVFYRELKLGFPKDSGGVFI